MTWLRFDPDEFWSQDVVERMDLDAAGLLLWLISRSWKTGAIRDDPAHYKAILRGKCKGFDKLWPVVREAFEQTEDGLRVPWLEEERESAEKRLKNDSARKALARTKQGMSGRSPVGVRPESGGSHKPKLETGSPTYGRTDETDETDKTNPPTPHGGVRTVFVPKWPDALNVPTVHAAWAEWERYRVEKRHRAYTPTGFARLVKPYIDPADLVAAIEHSIASNWQGIHSVRAAQHTRSETAPRKRYEEA